MHSRNTLPIGSVLDRYKISAILGEGGFGVTYLANEPSSGLRFAIKEYLPFDFSYRDERSTVRPRSESDRIDFMWGLARFKDEAFALVRFKHSAVVEVLRYFEANGTAYIVMPFYPGKPLSFYIKKGIVFKPDEAEFIFDFIMQGLDSVHKTGMVHRDIKPDNILLLDDGYPVLLDFGAARQLLGEYSQNMTRILTPPYAAYEQHQTKGHIGSWTDYYGLSATFYECITGQKPEDCMERFTTLHRGDADPLIPIARLSNYSHSERFVQMLMNGLHVDYKSRPKNYNEWKARVTSHAKTRYLKW